MVFKGLTLGLLLGIAVVSARPSKDTEHVASNNRGTRSVEPEGLKVSTCVCDHSLDKIKELIELLDEIKCPSKPGTLPHSPGNPNYPHSPEQGNLGGAPGQYYPGSPGNPNYPHPPEQGNPGGAPGQYYPGSPGNPNYPHPPKQGNPAGAPGQYYPGSPGNPNYPHPPEQGNPAGAPGQYYPGSPGNPNYPQSPQHGYPGNAPSQYPNSYQPQPGGNSPGQTPASPYYPQPQHPSPPVNNYPGEGQAPGPHYPSPQPGIEYLGPTQGQIQPVSQQPSYPVTGNPDDYTSNQSNPAPLQGVPSNSGSTPPTADITHDDNQPIKSSTTDNTSNQSINGNNNFQVSNVQQETTILAPGQTTQSNSQPTTPGTKHTGGAPSENTPTPQQPGTGYPGAPLTYNSNGDSNSVTAGKPLENTLEVPDDLSSNPSQPTSSNESSAPTENIQTDYSSQQDSIESGAVTLQNANGENNIENVNSNTVNIENDDVPNITIYDFENLEELSPQDNSTAKFVTQPSNSPVISTESSVPPSQIHPASQTGPTEIYDTTAVTNSNPKEIAIGGNIVQSQDSYQSPTVAQSYNSNVNSDQINPAEPQESGYQQPQQPYNSKKNDYISQETDNESQTTNIQFSPIFISKQDTNSQQTPLQTIREQGDIYSAPTTNPHDLVGHDVIYNSPSDSTVDNSPLVTPIYNTPPIYSTPPVTPIYNTPPVTPISYNPHPNGQETEIIFKGIRKQTYPYIEEIEFTGSGDIMNYFDMKQISGTPNTYGGFNSYQSCTKNLYDKDVQALKNELDAQHITLDKIVASLKKCNCYCPA